MGADAELEKILEAEASRKRAGWLVRSCYLWGCLPCVSPKWKEPQDLYTHAAEIQQEANLYSQAGDAYERAAECASKHKPYEAPGLLAVAAECYRKEMRNNDALRCLQAASNFCISKGKKTNAALSLQAMADIYKEMGEIDNHHRRLNMAVELFREGDPVESLPCVSHCADCYAYMKDWDRAASCYDEMLEHDETWDEPDMVKEFAFRAYLCRMSMLPCKENIPTEDDTGEECAYDVSQSYLGRMGHRTKEGYLADRSATAYDGGDPVAYAKAVRLYLRDRPVEGWKVMAMLEIEEKLTLPEGAIVDLGPECDYDSDTGSQTYCYSGAAESELDF